MDLEIDPSIKDDISCSPDHRSQFVNGKLWKVRWISNGDADSRFLTATYGDRENEVAVWSPMEDNESHECFKKEGSIIFNTDVRDLLVVNRKSYGIALNDGSVSLAGLSNSAFAVKQTIRPPGSCVSAHALCGDEEGLFIGYSSGTISLNDCSSGNSTIWTVKELSSVQALSMITSSVFASAHASGLIYVWDIRQKPEVGGIPQPTFSCIVTQLCDAVTAIANHPADLHMVGYGTSSGMVELLDTRLSDTVMESNPLPLAIGPVWEVGFHPEYPRNFYGAWNGGHLLHFETGTIIFSDQGQDNQMNKAEEKTARFSRLGEARVSDLLRNLGSVNTFSVSSKGILVGADSCILTLITKNYFT